MPYRLENRRIIRAALAAFAVAFALGATAAHAGFERSLEKMLGNQARNAIEAQYVVIAEGPAAEYLQRTGESLVDASPRHDIEYTFKLLDTEQVNAFALPWGYVYVTTGMLRFVDSSDQLAGVVGHEIAHVSQKHSLDAFKKQFWASLLLGVIEAPAALLTAGNVGATLYLLRHSRKDEQDSDKLGARYAYTAGYDASQLADFLRKLHAEQKRKPSSIEIYLSTHPTGERRQERLAELPELDQDNPEVAAHTARGFLDRHLANQAVVAYRRAASLAPADAEARAGLVRAYAEAGDAQLARQELARALEIGLSEEDARTLEMVVAEAPPAPGRDVSADESDAQPRVHSDEQRLADVREAAAAWSMDAQEPARKIEERSKSLGERVRGVARRMSMTGAFGSPAFGTQRVMEKAETALYLIAETTDRVGATGEGLKSVSATAGEILAAVERDSAAPAAAGDRARWQALAREIAEVVATAEEETQQVSEQALRAAKLADEAVGHLNSAVSAMATEFNAFGGLRGSAPFLGLAEGDADR
ncbi:MAG: M48 family metalloprotease, partial [Armatimonadota bacterium]